MANVSDARIEALKSTGFVTHVYFGAEPSARVANEEASESAAFQFASQYADAEDVTLITFYPDGSKWVHV